MSELRHRRGFTDRVLTAQDHADIERARTSVFYGYSAQIIAEWCGVSMETARKWKTGEQKPSRPALRLFTLHRERRVLTSPAWDGWFVQGDRLVDPEGNETTQGQLRAYYLVYQLARHLSRGHATAEVELDAIMRLVG